ncbi:MAG: extracellular solute-binding protein [Eubacteriales bacterium]|nr:extracellular solute-binding protein [Eubacteriales bacterium]
MATLKDIAKDAGVSIATVSCCLSGSKPVKAETRMRIMDSIEKLKYIPNWSARNLKSYHSNLIGVVLTDIDNLYHSEIFKGISAYLQNQDFTVSVAFSNNSPDIECQKIEDFISQNAAGLIIITCQPQNTDFFRSRILNYQIPTVFIERAPENLFANFTGFDNYQTAFYLTAKLLKKGYKKPALICGPVHFSSENDSIRGYKDALFDSGIKADDSLICSTNMSKEDAFKSVLTEICTQTPDSVITTSENMALGAIEAFNTYGLTIPDSVRIITYSEESWNKASRIPGVIHTERTAFRLGQSASELLLQNIKSPALFEPKIISMEDPVIYGELPLPGRDSLIVPGPTVHTNKLKVLMVDLATSRSIFLLSDYFTRKTGIALEFDFYPQNQMLDRISHTIDTDAAYDIHMYDVPWLNFMVQNTFVSDISDFINSPSFHKKTIFKENMDNCKCEGQYYGIPIIGGSQIMFYRKDLFENRQIVKAFQNRYQISLRPPKTWTEFNGTARFFTRSFNPDSPTEYGTSFAGITDEELAPEILIRLWAYGGMLWDAYNRPQLYSPENVRAMESILQTLQYTERNPFCTSIADTVADFSSGKTAMLITYTEYAAQITNGIHNNTIGRIGYEILPGKCPASIGWNMGLNPFSKNTAAAFAYFDWLTQHDTSYYMTILDGQSPVIAPYHSQELLKLYPWLGITERSFSYTHKRTGPYKNNTLIIPQNKIEAILCNVLHQILEDGISIEEALKKNEESMKHLFHSYGYPKPLCR